MSMKVPRTVVQTAIRMAIPAVANLFASHLDGYGDPGRAISPEELDVAIGEGRNLILDSLITMDPVEVAKVRSSYRWLAPEFRRVQEDFQGKWLPWKQVLHAYPLAKHRQHLAVIEDNPAWFEKSILEALDWLFGKTPA